MAFKRETGKERETRMREMVGTLSLTSAELTELAQHAIDRAHDIIAVSERTVAESRHLRTHISPVTKVR